MNSYKIQQVANKAHIKAFSQLPIDLYKNDNQWIRPIDDDIEKVFDSKRNKYFRHGTAIRWIMSDSNGMVVGRVAAFYDNKNANKGNEQPTGGMGFFECINDQIAANTLFDTCKNWLTEQGMEAMDGSINFGDRHENWGILVEGFDYPPNYQMPYSKPYYAELFENYGFEVYFKQLTYYRSVNHDNIGESVRLKAERIDNNPEYKLVNINKKELAKFAEDFRTVYNAAWANFDGVGQLSKPHSMGLMKQMKPILDERLMVFAYHNDEPVGFLIMMPELNQIFKHVNGKLNLIGKLKVLYYKNRVNKALGIVFGVTPSHQGRGLEGAMSMKFANVAFKKEFPYKDIELNWIGDFNPKMMHVVTQMGFEVRKIHHTYRYLFDRSKEFKRMRSLK
jgi:hypothetical protein